MLAGWRPHTRSLATASRPGPMKPHQTQYRPAASSDAQTDSRDHNRPCLIRERLRCRDRDHRFQPCIRMPRVITAACLPRSETTGSDPPLLSGTAGRLGPTFAPSEDRCRRGRPPTPGVAYDCGACTRSLDSSGKAGARCVTRWKPALNAFAITPSKAASRPMNTTRPDQIDQPSSIDLASPGLDEGCESRWLLILAPRRLSA